MVDFSDEPRVQSVGTVDRIADGACWGRFHQGARKGTTFDLPERFQINGGPEGTQIVVVELGNEIMFSESLTYAAEPAQTTIYVYQSDLALALHCEVVDGNFEIYGAATFPKSAN